MCEYIGMRLTDYVKNNRLLKFKKSLEKVKFPGLINYRKCQENLE